MPAVMTQLKQADAETWRALCAAIAAELPEYMNQKTGLPNYSYILNAAGAEGFTEVTAANMADVAAAVRNHKHKGNGKQKAPEAPATEPPDDDEAALLHPAHAEKFLPPEQGKAQQPEPAKPAAKAQPAQKPEPLAAQQVAPKRGRKLMTDYDKHIKAIHLEGKALIFTIRCVAESRLGKPREAAEVATIAGDYPEVKLLTPIVFFRETSKYLILSNTNRTALIQLFGPDPVKWIGQKVTLKAEQVKVGRKLENPVRVQTGNVRAEQAPDIETFPNADNAADEAALW